MCVWESWASRLCARVPFLGIGPYSPPHANWGELQGNVDERPMAWRSPYLPCEPCSTGTGGTEKVLSGTFGGTGPTCIACTCYLVAVGRHALVCAWGCRTAVVSVPWFGKTASVYVPKPLSGCGASPGCICHCFCAGQTPKASHASDGFNHLVRVLSRASSSYAILAHTLTFCPLDRLEVRP